MPVPLLKRGAIKIIDLLLLVVALFYLVSTAVATGQFSLFSLDFTNLVLMVFVSYLGILTFIGVLTAGFGGGDSPIAKFCRTAISGLLMFFLFPYVLGIMLWIGGMRITADIQLTLTLVAVLRVVVAGILGRYWDVLP